MYPRVEDLLQELWCTPFAQQEFREVRDEVVTQWGAWEQACKGLVQEKPQGHGKSLPESHALPTSPVYPDPTALLVLHSLGMLDPLWSDCSSQGPLGFLAGVPPTHLLKGFGALTPKGPQCNESLPLSLEPR